MYKVATPRVFLQFSEQVEAAWLRCRLVQRSGREDWTMKERGLCDAAGLAESGYWA